MVLDEVNDFRQFVRIPLLQEQQKQQEQLDFTDQLRDEQNSVHAHMADQLSQHDDAHARAHAQHFDDQFSHQAISSTTTQDPLVGIHSDNLPSHELDFPPRPSENILESPVTLDHAANDQPSNPQDIHDLLGLERELEFGLDRQF